MTAFPNLSKWFAAFLFSVSALLIFFVFIIITDSLFLYNLGLFIEKFRLARLLVVFLLSVPLKKIIDHLTTIDTLQDHERIVFVSGITVALCASILLSLLTQTWVAVESSFSHYLEKGAVILAIGLGTGTAILHSAFLFGRNVNEDSG